MFDILVYDRTHVKYTPVFETNIVPSLVNHYMSARLNYERFENSPWRLVNVLLSGIVEVVMLFSVYITKESCDDRR